jgi:hypothetical protein
LQLTAELFRMAHDELGEVADHVEAVRVVERLGGATIGGDASARAAAAAADATGIASV